MRLFLAVRPPDDVVERLAALPRPAVDGLRWTTPGQWHVTLRFLGRVDDPEPLVGHLRAAPAPLPVTVTLGPATDRFGQRVLHLPATGLDALASAVRGASAAFGEPRPPDQAFTGHLTLARVRNRARVDLRPLCGVAFAATWTSPAYTLEASDLHPDGARYTTLATFPAPPLPAESPSLGET